MSELSPSARRQLRAKAHALKPVVFVGGEGLSPAVLAEIERALRSHELIKIRVHGAERIARDAMLGEICRKTEAQAVQHIGKILVVYRANPEREEVAAETRPRRTGRQRR